MACFDTTEMVHSHLFLLQRRKTSECEFYEEVDINRRRYSNTYYSVKHPENTEKSVKWYIALNKRGRPRKAMTKKHRSSRFETKTTYNPINEPRPPKFVFTDSKSKKGSKKRYNREGGKNQPRIKLREGEDIQKADRLSDVLSSIETMLSKSSPRSGSSALDFRESMLIDLGGGNPFELFNEHPVRHSKAKARSRRRKTQYRRIER